MNEEPVSQRTIALKELVSLEQPICKALSFLSSFGWDCDEELVTFTRTDALRALQLFKTRDLRAEDLIRWAEALEGRDDLGFESGFEEVLKDFVFEISTFEINEPLNSRLAAQWERGLR